MSLMTIAMENRYVIVVYKKNTTKYENNLIGVSCYDYYTNRDGSREPTIVVNPITEKNISMCSFSTSDVYKELEKQQQTLDAYQIQTLKNNDYKNWEHYGLKILSCKKAMKSVFKSNFRRKR